MKVQSIQISFQNATEGYYGPRGDTFLRKEGFTEVEIQTGAKLGISVPQMRRIADGQEIVVGETIISKENLSSPDFQKEIAQAYDRKTIDNNESIALRKAEQLGLLNPKTAEELYIQAVEGTLDPIIKEEIEEVQTALKADEKYVDEIDGKWGINSRQALKDLVLENAEALILDSSQLERDQMMEHLQNPSRGFNR